jgi:PTH1 family peptidyl-tRNA hydrolase
MLSEQPITHCLILGLGNIGEEYAGTRHNIGFDVLDLIAADNFIFEKSYRLVKTAVSKNGERIVLGWPQTYMNRSGKAAKYLLEREQIDIDKLLVVVDDFALPIGSLRFRPSGSDGGHNGLASLSEELGTTDYARLRLGIGPLPEGKDVADFVLSPFSRNELEIKKKMVQTAAKAVIFASVHGVANAMNKYNRIVNPA